MRAFSENYQANTSLLYSQYEKIGRIKTYISNIFEENNYDQKELFILSHFICFPNIWVEYDDITILLNTGSLTWSEEFSSVLNDLYDKGMLMKDDDNDSFNMHQVLKESIQIKINIKIDDVRNFIEIISNILNINFSKKWDDSIIKFLPFAESILTVFNNSIDESIIFLQHKLSLLYSELWENKKSEKLLEIAVASSISIYGENHINVISLQADLGCMYVKNSKYVCAKELLILVKQYCYENPDTTLHLYALILSNFGSLYQIYEQDLYKGKKFIKKAIEIEIQLYGDSSVQVANSRDMLAGIYSDLGQISKAIQLRSCALKSLKNIFGNTNSNVARLLLNLSGNYLELGDLDKALRIANDALKINLQIFNENHPSTAICWNILGSIHQELKNFPEALEFHSKALKSDLNTFGKDSPEVSFRKTNLSILYRENGQTSKALELQNEAIEPLLYDKRKHWKSIIFAKNNLALIYQDMKKYNHAKVQYEEILKEMKQKYGKNHPDVAKVLTNLASVYKDQNDLIHALRLNYEAYKILSKTHGSDSTKTAIIQSNMAMTYKDLGDLQKACTHWMQAFEIFNNKLGKTHPNTILVADMLAKYCAGIN